MQAFMSHHAKDIILNLSSISHGIFKLDFIIWLIHLSFCAGFKSKNVQLPDSATVSAVSLEQTESQVFTFKQLQAATSNFNQVNVVGHGGFGSVYRGVLSDGRQAAIKQLDRSSKQGDHEFRIEVCCVSYLVLAVFDTNVVHSYFFMCI